MYCKENLETLNSFRNLHFFNQETYNLGDGNYNSSFWAFSLHKQKMLRTGFDRFPDFTD